MELDIIDEETPVAEDSSSSIVIEDEEAPRGGDLRAALTGSAIAPEEAAKNINRSRLFQISPDAYHSNKGELDADAEAFELVPDTIEPITKDQLTQSEQHASLGKFDIDNMNAFERRAKFFGQKVIDIPEKNREINDLVSEQMDSEDGILPAAKAARLQSLTDEIKGMSGSAESYGITYAEELITDVAGGVVDFIRPYWENKEFLAGTTGTGAAIGGGVGFVTPIPGAALVGMQAGGVKGFATGALIVGFVDSYKQSSRSTYHELSGATKEDGVPSNIPHERKANVARAVGVMSGVAGGLAGLAFVKANSFISRFASPKLAAKYLTGNPAALAKMDILGSMAKSVFSEGTEEAFQEFTQTVGTIFGKMDESEASFINALDEATDSENLKKYGRAGVVGGLTGGVIQGASGAMSYKGVKGDIQEIQDIAKRKEKASKPSYFTLEGGAVFDANEDFITKVQNSPEFKPIKQELDRVNKVTTDKQEVLSAQNNMLELAEDLKNTKMKDLAPAEMTKFQKKVFGALGVGDNVFLHLEDARKFANTPEKAAALKKVLDPTGQMVKLSQEFNTPLKINKGDMLDIVSEFPELSDYMRLTPDGENPLSIRNEAVEFPKRVDEANLKREELTNAIDVENNGVQGDETNPLAALKGTDLTKKIDSIKSEIKLATDNKVPANLIAPMEAELAPYETELTRRVEIRMSKEAEAKASLTPLKESKYFASSQAYLGQSAIQAIPGIVTQAEVDKLNQVQLEARLAVDANVTAPVDERFDKYADAEFKTETGEEIALEVEELSKEFAIIKSFESPLGDTETNVAYTKEHKKPGFSAFAIDPKSLSPSQKAMYDNKELNPAGRRNLKKRKAFIEGGIHVEQAAALQGLESGEQLLKILAETPSRKQIENRIKNDPLRNKVRPIEIEESMYETKRIARDEAIGRETDIHLKEAEFIASKDYSTLKKGINKIARKPPRSKELNQRAKIIVADTLISDLDPKMWESAGQRTQAAALKNFTDGQIAQAFDNKIKVAQNNELKRETLNALDKVNKFKKFWKRANSETNIQELKDAGMFDVMEEYMSLYKLDGNLKGQTEQKAFNAFMKRQEQAGQFVPKIPDRLNNTQASYKDLTVQQYQTMTEMGQFILHQAKLKNKLLRNIESRNAFETMETIRDDIKDHLEGNHDFDPKKAEKEELKTKDQQEIDEIKNTVKTGLSIFSSLESIVSELDEHVPDGPMYRLISDPIAKATQGERLTNSQIVERGKEAAISSYGSIDKLQELLSQRVEVPEFKNFPKIGDGEGSVRKIDLIYMFAHLGDEYAKEQLGNFVDRDKINITPETILAVLERELTDNDAAFAQNFLLNTLKAFEKPTADLQKRMTGIEPEMVKGVPIVFKGKVYPGGYFPVDHVALTAEEKTDLEMEGIETGDSDSKAYSKMRAAEQTEQGRTKSRTGSKRQLDLDYNNFFSYVKDTIHDLHFREVGVDTLKILKDKNNAANIKAVVGASKYGVLLDSVKDIISDSSNQGAPLFAKQFGWVEKRINGVVSLYAIQAIGFNINSAAMQTTSLGNLALRAGPQAPIFLAKTITRLGKDIENWDKHVAFAAKILPDIQLEQDQIDDSLVRSSKELIPSGAAFTKKYKKLGKGRERLRKAREAAVDLSFEGLRAMDKTNKVLAVHSLTEQFFNGKIPGHSLDKINKLSNTEKFATLQRVVKQTIDLSLTALAAKDKTPLEKMKLGKLLVNFWADRRSRLNSVRAQGDKIRGALKRREIMKAANHLLTLALVTGAMKEAEKLIKDDEESILNRLKDVDGAGAFGQFALETTLDFAKAPVTTVLGDTPLVDTAVYVYDQFTTGKSRTLKPVSSPFFAVLTNGVLGYIALTDFLESGLAVGDVPDKDRKAMLTSAGYLARGVPTNAVNKMIDSIEDSNMQIGDGSPGTISTIKNIVLELHDTIDRYIDKYKDDPNSVEIIEDLIEEKKNLPQLNTDVRNILPEGVKETLKQSLSQGEWKKADKETGAFGIYQFTEERWNELMVLNPDMGLTENGRVAKDSTQQEKAMDWVIQDNTRTLLMYDLEITDENLLGAHKFGADNFVAIAGSKDEDSLKTVLGEATNSPVFKDFKTVAEVKRYLKREVNKVKELTNT